MKILVAYDGSESADTAIDGLRRAGLPKDGVEAVVLSVAEVWLPPPARDEVIDDTFPFQIPAGLKQAREHATRIMADAEELAERGKKGLQHLLPQWSVTQEVRNGSPAAELLNGAEKWQSQLIVMGSHGHTAVGRFVLGSVSQTVLTEARSSVRIGRRTTGVGDSAERIIVGVDGSPGSDAAVQAVAQRHWSPGSEVRVVVAQDLMKAFPVSLLVPAVKESVDAANKGEHTGSEEMTAAAVKVLRSGLDQSVTISSVIENGDPKQMLVQHAHEFGADCVFMGASGFSNRIERFVLGSVSAAVAARAHCSVEVVRERQSTSTPESS